MSSKTDKFNKSTYSQGNLATMATLTPSQNPNLNDELLDMKLNEVRKLNKQQEQNVELLKCRLNHISVQDQYGQRNISRTKHEINSIVKTKERVYLDLQKKRYIEELKEKMLHDSYQRVTISRQERDRRAQQIELSNKLEQQIERQIYSDTYQQMHKDYKQDVTQAKTQTLNEIYSENARSHKIIRHAHLSHQQEKIQKQEEIQQFGYMNYHSQVQYEAELYKKRQEQLNQLEQNESKLMNKLRMTQNQDRSMSAKREEIKKLPYETFTPKRNLFRITSQQS